MLKKLKSEKLKKIPVLLIKLFIVIIVLTAVVFSIYKMMEYNRIKKESEILQSKIDGVNSNIGELRYYLNSEVNEKYKEKMAQIMGYNYPDDTIYYMD